MFGYIFVAIILIFTSNELYLEKACKVNLNYTEEICDNMNSHSEIQIEVQKYVSEVQAYNGVLQSLPAIIFTFFLGSLSDKFGRKPLLLIGLAGSFILNIVFLVNCIWFYELKVEFLLFECLQDILGGEAVFIIGAYSLIADLTKEKNRTRRMAGVEALRSLGTSLGFIVGGQSKASLGWVGMYIMTLCVIVLTAVLVIFKVQEAPRSTDDPNINESEAKELKGQTSGGCKQLVCGPLSAMKKILRHRENGTRIWICCFVITKNLQTFIETGTAPISFMFLYRQYKLSFTDISRFTPLSTTCSLFVLLVLVPFLNKKLSDTAIIIIALFSCTIGYALYGLNTDPNFLWFVFPMFGFYGAINGVSQSILTKLVDSSEIGGVLTLCGVIQAALALASKPFYALVYRSTVEKFPAAFIFICVGLYCIVIIIMFVAHFGMKRLEKKNVDNASDKT